MSIFKYQNKDIYYEDIGEGEPLFFLHGNSASSSMFDSIVDLYSKDYRVIRIDFLGHGRSERLDGFPIELWYDEAMQTIALMKHLHLGKVNLIGTSGGAWVAINVALEAPDLVNKVIADSFDGRALTPDFPLRLRLNRAESKTNEHAIRFYASCHGKDWEKIVDQDTESLLRFMEAKLPLFHKRLDGLNVPLLLTASKADDLIRSDREEEFDAIIREVREGKKHLFESGYHPAVVSNDREFASIVKEFLSNGLINKAR
ncbi:MAG: alpha/beta hydrolase [Firmicutes bacterium GWF2_51_9]|nr:alpha/beta hydrolase [Erysipelotrichaceae bacterium]OGS53989.1 MAG: alpha/beta hydrolase [Firmicutes bacterium GWF2_51_9]OGS57469.1 MAG: alpha/beta hydrolase [Firmicutes bacterium GWE2_51_13]HAM63953.1 alpha/beta hydrolase [Erysipelotrichaceae bacterium]HBZ42070.1 alpha/beta hydrolase [Erysipelotrichaceae bacterium]